jgi:hypothetical protein
MISDLKSLSKIFSVSVSPPAIEPLLPSNPKNSTDIKGMSNEKVLELLSQAAEKKNESRAESIEDSVSEESETSDNEMESYDEMESEAKLVRRPIRAAKDVPRLDISILPKKYRKSPAWIENAK